MTDYLDIPPQEKREPWERQEGESNFWYARFHRFMMYGSSRSLNQCYRDVINEIRVAKGREKLQKSARAGGTWLKKAREFDWWSRAEAWDNHRRIAAMKAVADSLDLIRFAAQEAVEFQLNLMRGVVKLKDDEGKEMEILLSLDEIQQMRLASNSILNRAGVVYDGPAASEDDGEIEVIGIKINMPPDNE